MNAMTGSWLIVKWVGISITAAYLLLMVLVCIRFRRDLSRLRHGLILPAALGVFISVSVPSIFGDVIVARTCFIAAVVIYIGGIGILLKGLVQKNHQGLLRADS
jgi:hypothetical protein